MFYFYIQLLDSKDTVIILGDVNYEALEILSMICKRIINIPITRKCYINNNRLRRESNIFILNHYIYYNDITSSSEEIFKYKYKCLIITCNYIFDRLILNRSRYFPLIILSGDIQKFYFPNIDFNIDGNYLNKEERIIIVDNEAIYQSNKSHRIRLYSYDVLYVININTHDVGIYENYCIMWHNKDIWIPYI